MSRCGLEMDAVCKGVVIKSFGNVGNLHRAFLIFSRSKHVDGRVLNALIRACAKNDKEDEAMRAYRLGLEKGGKPDAAMVDVLMETALRVKNLRVSWDIWDLYRHHRISPTATAVEIQLQLCANWIEDSPERYGWKADVKWILHRVDEVLDSVSEFRLPVSRKAAWLIRTVLSKKIIALARFQHFEDAFLVIERHIKHRRGVAMDILVVNTFLTHVVNVVKSLSLAWRILDLIKSDLNLRPDAFTLTAMMRALGDAGCSKLAEDIFKQLVREGDFVPTAICYVSLITACGKNGDSEHALKAFNMAKESGMVSAEVTAAVIGAHIRSGFPEKAFHFDDPSSTPSLRVSNSLIDACAQSRDINRAWEYFGRMTKSKISPNLKTLHCLLISKRSTSWDIEPSVDEIMRACSNLEYTWQTYFLLLELATGKRKEAIREEMRVKGFEKQYIAIASFFTHGRIMRITNGPVKHGEFFHVDPEFCGRILKEVEVATGWVPERGGLARFHAEKKAFCYLLHILRPDECLPTIQLSLRMCMDCHQFFQYAAAWANKRIVVHDIIQIHVFTSDGVCSCGNGFKPWEKSEILSKIPGR